MGIAASIITGIILTASALAIVLTGWAYLVAADVADRASTSSAAARR